VMREYLLLLETIFKMANGEEMLNINTAKGGENVRVNWNYRL
jgi:hypothetical protein